MEKVKIDIQLNADDTVAIKRDELENILGAAYMAGAKNMELSLGFKKKNVAKQTEGDFKVGNQKFVYRGN